LTVLEEWSREEKEERSEGIRAKKTAEPVYVGGRLRAPRRSGWHREVEDEPYRFTYFNDELPATIHSHTISELLQPGQTFKDLFRPDLRILDDSSEESDDEGSRSESEIRNERPTTENDSAFAPPPSGAQNQGPGPVRTGTRPTFWLDVMSPTEAEMKVFIRAFGIHPLTAEDIMMQETREKVELFRSYYLVSYRTFEQDTNSENYLEPVNIYVVVFREGVLSVFVFPPLRKSLVGSDTILVSFFFNASSGQRSPTHSPIEGLHHRISRLDIIRADRRHHRCLCPSPSIFGRRSR
jgi:magnesium transporter